MDDLTLLNAAQAPRRITRRRVPVAASVSEWTTGPCDPLLRPRPRWDRLQRDGLRVS